MSVGDATASNAVDFLPASVEELAAFTEFGLFISVSVDARMDADVCG